MSKIDEFEEWAYERFARNTVVDTVRKIKALSKKIDLEDRESIMGFLRQLRKDGVPPKRINEHLKYLNRWLAFKNQDKILKGNTIEKYPIFRCPQTKISSFLPQKGNTKRETLVGRLLQ